MIAFRLSAMATRVTCMILGAALLFPLAAKSRPYSSAHSAANPAYAHALAAANRFLQAWQSGDVEAGMVLLSNDAKNKLTSDALEQYFSREGTSAYEITRGKTAGNGRYGFPVALVTMTVGNHDVHRRFSTILMVRTGENDWAVDKLP